MPKHPPISDWKLERYLLKELPPEEMAALDQRLQGDPDLGARLRELEASNAAILAAHPPGEVAAAIQRKAHVAEVRQREVSRKGGWSLAFRLAPALAAVVLAVMVFLPNYGPFSGPREETVRFKGLDSRIVLYRQGAAGAEALPGGTQVKAGDVIQVAYVAAGAGFGVVISVDGNGAVTTHLPEGAPQAATLEPSGEVPLAHAYELDDAPGFERFFLVTGSKPFAAAIVEEAARKLAADLAQAQTGLLGLPDGLEQTSVLLRK